MAHNSSGDTTRPEDVERVKGLLDRFAEKLEEPDLREQVRSLIPVVRGVRKLGSGLISEDVASSAQERILTYFRRYPLTLIDGDELLVVSGIGEWARRVRELRVEFGWWICSGVTFKQMAADDPDAASEITDALGVQVNAIKPTQYVLASEEQDRDAAHRWNVLNTIRKKKNVGVKAKILEYLRANAGHAVSGEELRYIANNRKEWSRRARELRTEDGWPVVTKMQGRPDLPVGSYLLEEDKQAEEHDRDIPDSVRIEVLERDHFACTHCGWTRAQLQQGDPRKFLELHHLVHHVEKGENLPENLKTLCNVHHDEVHAGRLVWQSDRWTKPNE
jgi:hypothetical protein